MGLKGLQLEPSVDGSLLAFVILSSDSFELEPGFRATEEMVWRAGDGARPLI